MARTRLTATERSEQLLAAAVKAFAEKGYAGTTTDDVARIAGVSQPYVVRLFGGKQRLFIAAVEHVTAQIEQRFREAAAVRPNLGSLADAYNKMLAERDMLVVLLHGFAVGPDSEIGPVARRCFGRIYHVVREITGASAEEVCQFMASGMLLTVLATMRVVGPDAVPAEPWVVELLSGLTKPLPASLEDLTCAPSGTSPTAEPHR